MRNARPVESDCRPYEKRLNYEYFLHCVKNEIRSDGTVKLMGQCYLWPVCPAPSRHQGRNFGNCTPRGKPARKQKTIVLGLQYVTADVEQIIDDAEDRQEALRMRDRLEASHPPLPRSRWLMGIFRAIVRPLVTDVKGTSDQARTRLPVARQPVRHHHAWCISG